MGSRPGTRSTSRLQLPSVHNHGERGHSSRSPSPAPRIDGNAFFDATVDSTDTMSTRTFTEDEVRQIAADAVEAALAAVPRPVVCSGRKPDLPAFDQRHIEVWIQRVEAAYTRSSITSPKDKFAFLETKIDINLNPKLNEFLFGPQTTERWEQFLQYLRKEYGPTRQPQAASLLNGICRDGRRPSQFLAQIEEKTKDLTLDDIRKEVIFRDLPPQVCHALASHVVEKSAKELAEMADAYFDKDGKHLHTTAASTVYAVDETPGLITDDEDHDINAIGPRSRRSHIFTPAFSSGNQQSNSNRRPQTQQPSTAENSSTQQPCRFHKRYGKDAYKCMPGCLHYAEFKKNPNAQAGRRA